MPPFDGPRATLCVTRYPWKTLVEPPSMPTGTETSPADLRSVGAPEHDVEPAQRSDLGVAAHIEDAAGVHGEERRLRVGGGKRFGGERRSRDQVDVARAERDRPGHADASAARDGDDDRTVGRRRPARRGGGDRAEADEHAP